MLVAPEAPRCLVYGLIDPANPRHIYYVGITSRHPARRYAEHVHYGKHPDGVVPAMVLLEDDVPEAKLEAREAAWIRRLKRIGMAEMNSPKPKRSNALTWARRRVNKQRDEYIDNGIELSGGRIGGPVFVKRLAELMAEAERLFPYPSEDAA